MSLNYAFVNEFSTRLRNNTESIVGLLASHYGFPKEEAINILNKELNDYICSSEIISDNGKLSCFDDNNRVDLLRVDTNNHESPETSQEKPKKKRGRPKKVIDDKTSSEKVDETPKKKRGRPKKNNNITIVQDTDDESNSIEHDTKESNIKEPSSTSIACLINESNSEIELKEDSYSDNEDMPEIEVEKWIFDGKEYLKDERNHVYDAKTHESFGFFNEEENRIVIMSED